MPKQPEYILINDDDDEEVNSLSEISENVTLKISTTLHNSTSKKRSCEQAIINNHYPKRKKHFYQYRYEEDTANWIQEHSGTRFEKLCHVDIFDFEYVLNILTCGLDQFALLVF